MKSTKMNLKKNKNESEIENSSEIYKNEFEIENARSQIDKNVSVINNEFEVVSEGYKMEVAALNVFRSI